MKQYIFVFAILIAIKEGAQEIPKDFVKIGENYYFLSTNRVGWIDAELDCIRRGSHLATIQSTDEWVNVTNFVKKKILFGVWLGCNCIDDVSHWQCIENGEKMNYTDWSKGQPDNTFDTERCLQMWYQNNTYEMNDYTCKERIRYLCKATPTDCKYNM